MRKNLLVQLYLVSFLLFFSAHTTSATELIPGSVDNLDGTYTYTLRPSGGLNDGTDTGGATSGKDAKVLNCYPGTACTGNNYASEPASTIYNSNCNVWLAYVYIQFDLTGMPDTSDIVSVDFQYYNTLSPLYAYPSTLTYDIHRAAGPWSENTITMNNQPADDGVIATENIPEALETMITFDGFTDIYKNWKDGIWNNYGFSIRRQTQVCESATTNQVYTSDNSTEEWRPALIITYRLPVPVPAMNNRAVFILALLMAGSAFWFIRLRKKTS